MAKTSPWEGRMDPVSLGYYAVICGILGVASARLPSPLPRFLLGVAVGVVEAAILPYLKQLIGAA